MQDGPSKLFTRNRSEACLNAYLWTSNLNESFKLLSGLGGDNGIVLGKKEFLRASL